MSRTMNDGDTQEVENEEQIFNRAKQLFREFLADGVVSESPHYAQQFKDLYAGNSKRLIVSVADLDAFRHGFAEMVLQNPSDFLPAFDEALLETLAAGDGNFSKKAAGQFPRVGFEGVFGARQVTPRGLTADLLGSLVCLEGIVTRCSISHPRLAMSVHYSHKSNQLTVREHRDQTNLKTAMVEAASMPKVDQNGFLFEMETSSCRFKDYQRFTLQEMPELAPTGQMPRSAEVLVCDDLVDLVKPGDRIRVVGIYKAMSPPLQSLNYGVTSGQFRCVVVGIALAQLQREMVCPNLTGEQLQKIKAIAGSKDTFEILAESFAPSISGRMVEKKGMLLMMLGGVEKNLATGTHLRGDINILLLGDPSCGKSQMLRFVMNLAPLAICTTGRGSSGVGLTAAVTTEQGTGERYLEAGAMVLADRGIACIDEFDKMSAGDRVAIHEVMEQQTVTIAKAGIHTTLNARCSLLAAANPVYGNFEPSLTLNENINLPDSLLSRFDLVFIVRDLMSQSEDRRIAKKVLSQCQLRIHTKDHLTNTASQDTTALMLKGRVQVPTVGDILPVEFLRKYILFARAQVQPVLSETAIEHIVETYQDLRRNFAEVIAGGRVHGNPLSGLVVTTRTLEALIRLSTAHAKLKLNSEVRKSDVLAAASVLYESRSQDKPTVQEVDDSKTRKNDLSELLKAFGGGEDDDDNDGEGGGEGGMGPSGRSRLRRTSTADSGRRRGRSGSQTATNENLDKKQESNRGRKRGSNVSYTPRKRSNSAPRVEAEGLRERPPQLSVISNENDVVRQLCEDQTSQQQLSDVRLGELRQIVQTVFAALPPATDYMPYNDLWEGVKEGCGTEISVFSPEEFAEGLQVLQAENKLMVTDTHVFIM